MKEKQCINCVHSKCVLMDDGYYTYPCQLGYDIYMACQEAYSIDKFQPIE